MKAQNISLSELAKLATSLEDGGATGLSDADLAFVGAVLSQIVDQAIAVRREVEKEAFNRMNSREAETLALNNSSIKRTWKNEYHPNLQALFDQIIGIDVDAAKQFFEFLPETREVVVTPPRIVLRTNITPLKNWVERLGTGDQRRELEKLMGAQKIQPKLTFKAVDPETGEIVTGHS